MGQITIYLAKDTENKLRVAAKTSGLSLSKWISTLIQEKVAIDWPEDIVELAGSWTDDFPSLEDIRSSRQPDSPREDF